MTLTSYKEFFKKVFPLKTKPKYLQPVMVVGDLHGYAFLCPGCENRHFLPTNVSDAEGRRWIFNGDLDSPSFSPSFHFITEHEDRAMDVCFGWITDGKIDFSFESTHKFAGEIVEMKEIS